MPRTHFVVAIPLLFFGTFAAGCGSAADESAKAPQAILTDTINALMQQHSWHISATRSDKSETLAADVTQDAVRLHFVNLRNGLVDDELVVGGRCYGRRSDQNGALAGKWVIEGEGTACLQHDAPSNYADCLRQVQGNLSRGAMTVLAGREVIPLTSMRDGGMTATFTIYIRVTSPAIPLELTFPAGDDVASGPSGPATCEFGYYSDAPPPAGDPLAVYSFSAFGEQPAITPPPSPEVAAS